MRTLNSKHAMKGEMAAKLTILAISVDLIHTYKLVKAFKSNNQTISAHLRMLEKEGVLTKLKIKEGGRTKMSYLLNTHFPYVIKLVEKSMTDPKKYKKVFETISFQDFFLESVYEDLNEIISAAREGYKKEEMSSFNKLFEKRFSSGEEFFTYLRVLAHNCLIGMLATLGSQHEKKNIFAFFYPDDVNDILAVIDKLVEEREKKCKNKIK